MPIDGEDPVLDLAVLASGRSSVEGTRSALAPKM